MVISAEFKKFLKTEKGREVRSIILNDGFWNNCLIVVKVMGPLMRLLHLCDTDEKPSLGYVYEGLWRSIKGIKVTFRNKEHLYKRYVDIVNAIWDKMLRKRLHAAALWLNPAFQYDPESPVREHDALKGLLDIMQRLVPADESLDLMNEVTMFRERKKSFGMPLAISSAKSTRPDEWWKLFGIDAPHLQKLAVRILSQTSSSSGCERNWNVFEHIHTSKRNRLEHQRLNDLVYFHYNLRLQNRGKEMKRAYDPIDYECIDRVHFWVVEKVPNGELDYDELEECLEKEIANNQGNADLEIEKMDDHIDLIKLDGIGASMT